MTLVLIPAEVEAVADVLRQKDGGVIYGRILAQSADEIVFLQRVSDAQYIERRVSTADVESLVRTIDENRLSSLSPERPADYLSYAEELALVRSDPESHALAVRLYLIAARLNTGETRGHCLRGLLGLARNSEERRRFSELAFRLDSTFPSSVLVPPPSEDVQELTESELEELIRAVQGIRRGTPTDALEIIQRGRTQAALKRYAAICSIEQLQRFAGDPPRGLGERQALLKLEYALTCLLLKRPPPEFDHSWGLEWTSAAEANWVLPDLSNATEFNPELSVYRDGVWLAR
jgi:hypothetical protein